MTNRLGWHVVLVLTLSPLARADFVDWTDTVSGVMSSTSLSITGLTDGPERSLSTYDLTDAPFIASPGAGDQECLNFLCDDDWTANFGQPLSDVKLYAIAWRGVDGGATPVQYAFNRSFIILGGFAGAGVAGNTLTLPEGTFYDGILQFNGAFSSLSVTSNATLENAQAMTFYAANLPEPSAALVGAFGVTPLLCARRHGGGCRCERRNGNGIGVR